MGPLRMRCESGLPATYSIAMYRSPWSVRPKSKSVTMLRWRRREIARASLKKRRSVAWSPAKAFGKIFRATSRSTMTW